MFNNFSRIIGDLLPECDISKKLGGEGSRPPCPLVRTPMIRKTRGRTPLAGSQPMGLGDVLWMLIFSTHSSMSSTNQNTARGLPTINAESVFVQSLKETGPPEV